MYEKDLSMLERLSAEFRRRATQGRTSSMDTAAAYETLGIGPDATEAEVRRAYRVQMSRHHPDKLAHQQPSAERLARAAARTDSVRKAYEAIRRARGW
jgi:DnaJ like chaperone protein